MIHSVTLTIDNYATFTLDNYTGAKGYELYMSYDNTSFVKVETRVDSSLMRLPSISTTKDLTYTYFNHQINEDHTYGRSLYFYIKILNSAQTVLATSETVTVPTYPSIVENVMCTFDNYDVTVTWDAVDTTDGNNEDVSEYRIYRSSIEGISGSTLDTTNVYLLLNTAFAVGDVLWVSDSMKRLEWYGVVETAGEFDLTSTGILEVNCIANVENISIDNITVNRELTAKSYVGSTTNLYYTDSTFVSNNKYIYNVAAYTILGGVGNFGKYPIFTLPITEAYPYIRSYLYSSTGLLSNPYWANLKQVLVDENYYDKATWAIPYSKDESFNIKGYLGLSDCKVDIYVNDIYNSMVTTTSTGEFSFNHKFPRTSSTIKIQCRDKSNVDFSRISAPIEVRPLNLYTWFSLLGDQYKDMIDELDSSIEDISIENCRYSSFVDRFTPLIELNKNANEDEVFFKNIAIEIFKSFEFGGYDKSLRMFLDALQDNIINFDHYEIFYNDEYNETKQTGFSFIVNETMYGTAYVMSSTGYVITSSGYVVAGITTSSGLERDDYYYGISSTNALDEESDVLIQRVDCRWWPEDYKGYIILNWDVIPEATRYKIYRGTTETDLHFMTYINGNLFVDIGAIELFPEHPPVYGFVSYDHPAEIRVIRNNRVGNDESFFRRYNWMHIVIYTKDNQEFYDYEIDRILFYLRRFIPPETRYGLVYANDDFSRIYDGLNADTTRYELSNPNMYYCTGDLFTRVDLDITNSEDGTTDVACTARYLSSIYKKYNSFTSLTFIGSGDSEDIMYQYRTSENNLVWSDWTTETDAIGTITIDFVSDIKFIEFKWYFYGLITDPDYFYVTNLI